MEMTFTKQNIMNLKLIFGLLLLMMASCAGPSLKKENIQRTTDPDVKLQLQGVWLDKNTESPVLEIDGDSLLYASNSDVRMPYCVVDDTLFVRGIRTAAYPILERSEHTLSIRTPMGDEMSLYKDENGVITIEQPKSVPVAPVKHVIKKDSVIMVGKNRYRGYITINPTTIKVIRPGVTEDGFLIDNVYYDNIIHICVYEGRKELCSKDIKRSMFESIVPSEFLSVSILQDMNFEGMKNKKFVFNAVLRVPDGPSFYAQVLIDEDSRVEVASID